MYSVLIKTRNMGESVLSDSAQGCVNEAKILEPSAFRAIQRAKKVLLDNHFGGTFDYIKIMAVSMDHLN